MPAQLTRKLAAQLTPPPSGRASLASLLRHLRRQARPQQRLSQWSLLPRLVFQPAYMNYVTRVCPLHPITHSRSHGLGSPRCIYSALIAQLVNRIAKAHFDHARRSTFNARHGLEKHSTRALLDSSSVVSRSASRHLRASRFPGPSANFALPVNHITTPTLPPLPQLRGDVGRHCRAGGAPLPRRAHCVRRRGMQWIHVV